MIYGGASTFSKMSCNYPENYPTICTGGNCVNMYASGNLCFDTVSALGARLIDNIGQGMQSLPHINEGILAQMLKKHFPFIEMVRYGCNGADATEGAIRYARAHTGRPLVYSVGYHSCQSAFTFNTPPALGCINGCIHQLPDLDELIKELLLLEECHTVGAVIIEPVMLNLDVEERLREIRRITAENGIVLIFDEIITGFRVPHRSVANWFDITPDLILLGKSIGGGYPLSIIGGPEKIMNQPIFHSYTFAGLPIALEKAINICSLPDSSFDRFWEEANYFMIEFNVRSEIIKLRGYATRGTWEGPDELKYTFWQEMYRKGYFLGPAFFPKMSWSKDDYNNLLETAISVLEDIEANKVKLFGKIPEPIFRRNR